MWKPASLLILTLSTITLAQSPQELVQDALQDDRFVAMMLNRIPFGRFGTPLEMAGAVLFFASPAASFVTGQILFIDGGVTASS